MSRRHNMLAVAIPVAVTAGILSGCAPADTEDSSAKVTALAEPSATATPESIFHLPDELVDEKSGDIEGFGLVVLQTYNDGTAEVRLFVEGTPAHWSRLDCEDGDLYTRVPAEDGASLIGSLLVADTTVCGYDELPIEELYEVVVASDIFDGSVVSV